MKILIVGAGVLGSVVAAKLQNSGHRVSLLARGQRLADLREHGLVIENYATRQRETASVQLLETLDPEEFYDAALVLVRKNQLERVLELLRPCSSIPYFVFMHNNAAGPRQMVEALGAGRVLLGFPGGGGERDGWLVRYLIASRRGQPTVLGELDGSISSRLIELGQVMEAAGFPIEFSQNMDAYQKTHVVLISPIVNALYLAGGDNYRLARTRDGVVFMVRAIREGLHVLKRLGIPVTPRRYRALTWLPEPLLVSSLRRILATQRAELALARHANTARDEMQELAGEVHSLAQAARMRMPNFEQLCQFIEPAEEPLPDGLSDLALNWRGVVTILTALTGSILLIRSFQRRKK
jgi:2-dehydropantoate 2-reductase